MDERPSSIIPPAKGTKSPTLGSSSTTGGPRRSFRMRQWMMWVLLVVVVLMMLFVKNMWRGQSDARVEDLRKSATGTINSKAFEETWMSQEGGKIRVLEQELEKLRRELAKTSRGAQSPKPPPVPGKRLNPKDMMRQFPPIFAESSPKAPPPPPPLPPRQQPPVKPGAESSPPSVRVESKGMSPSLVPASLEEHLTVVVAKAPASVAEPEKVKTFHLPSGTIISGRLLMGVNAPTLDQGANNPHPLLMEVTDLGILPNDFLIDIAACFVLGEGVGNLSSERVDVRLLRMSCVREDHEAVDIEVKGIVSDSDGVAGITGNVVWKEKALLTRALMAGAVQGVSQAFQPFSRGFTISRNADDAFNFPDPRQAGLAGLAGGVGQAAEELTRFYTRILSQIVPVIEVKPNRNVNMIITEGRELAKPLFEPKEG